MARPWVTLDRVDSPQGPLELRRRDAGDFLITVGKRVLMNSRAHRSEVALAEIACRYLDGANQPVVLIGGLGMGYTLRAALDVLPASARVIVAEINAAVVGWCRGPLAALTDGAVDDPRVDVRIEDVTSTIARAATAGESAKLDAVLLDLYEGPGAARSIRGDPLYGVAALQRTRAALRRSGALAVWCEQPSSAFERCLRDAGYRVQRDRPGRGGLRHAVYVAHPVQ